MTDLEIMQRAKMYIDKLANGINPIDDFTLSDNDIVNNVRVSRCLFYVSDILRQVIDNGGITPKKKTSKENFYISNEDVQKFSFSDTPIPISEIAKRINDINQDDNMKKILHKHLTDWLISIDMLYLEVKPDGKTAKMPTEKGKELGITTEIRQSLRGDYAVVLYNYNAQQFIINNIDSVISLMYK